MAKFNKSRVVASQNKTSFWYGVTNPKWLSIKAMYFFIYGGIAAFLPYLMVFFASLGLTVPQIGMIEFLNILVGMVSKPVIGSIADKSGRHSLVLGFCIIGALIPGVAIGFFSHPSREQLPAILMRKTGFLNETNSFELVVCDTKQAEVLSNTTSISVDSKPSLNSANLQLLCKDLLVSNRSAIATAKPQTSNNCSIFALQFQKELEISVFNGSESIDCNAQFQTEVVDNTPTFVWMCLLRSLSVLFLGAATALTDSIAYGMLGPQHRGLWGQQRMFGTLAWGVSAGTMGPLIDYFHTFKICFATYALLYVACALVAFLWLPKRLYPTGHSTQQEKRVPFCKALRTVLISPVFCIICVVAIASGMLLSIVLVIWPQHITQLGVAKLYIGLAAAILCTLEVPSLFFAGTIVDRIGAPVCFLLMFLAYMFRFGGNAFLTPETAWIALPLESLHIFCFAFFFAAATRTTATIAPPGTASTVQAIVDASFSGIGTGAGVLWTSVVFHLFGRQTAFFIYAAFALFCFLVLLIIYFVYLRKAVARILKPAGNSAFRGEAKLGTETPVDPLMNADLDEL